MSENCKERPNFGTPECVDVFDQAVRAILTPARASNGSDYVWNLDQITYESFFNSFYEQNPSDRIFALPEFKNFEWQVGDTQFEEASNAEKAFLKDGKTTIVAELWDTDGTPITKGKLSKMRCADWNLFLVTQSNKLVGEITQINNALLGTIDVFRGIPLSRTSVDSKFMFKTDSATQKVMFSVDLYRSFDSKDLYSIDGNKLYDSGDNLRVLNFLNPPVVVDSNLKVTGTPTTTTVDVIANDDYRQGERGSNVDAGNLTGLTLSDFIVTNLTTGIIVPISGVVEGPNGQYALTFTAVTSGDKMKVELALDSTNSINYAGQTSWVTP